MELPVEVSGLPGRQRGDTPEGSGRSCAVCPCPLPTEEGRDLASRGCSLGAPVTPTLSRVSGPEGVVFEHRCSSCPLFTRSALSHGRQRIISLSGNHRTSCFTVIKRSETVP